MNGNAGPNLSGTPLSPLSLRMRLEACMNADRRELSRRLEALGRQAPDAARLQTLADA
ncbi:MAG: hypothetical protein JSS51_08410, partial [Planctomycetes bacterium]|nr:hypothetical protein [Planctomycetota bacterium]